MANFRYIEFQQIRDFGDKVSATLSFVIQNFKSLFRSLLYIAGPPVLVVSILLGSFMGDYFSLSLQRTSGNPQAITDFFSSGSIWLQIAMIFIFFVVSIVVTTATANNYLILYREKKTNQIEVNDVWIAVRSTFWKYFLSTLMFGFFGIIVYIVLLIPTFLLAAINPFLIFFGIIFFIGAFAYLYIGASLVYVIQAFENKSFTDAIARSFSLIRGKWWSTLATLLVLSMLIGIISSIFMIPAYVILIVTSLHDIGGNSFQGPSGTTGLIITVLMTLYYLSQMILTCLPNIGLAFQYFNLVERKEATGLMNQIDTLGQAPPPPIVEEHY